MDVRAEGIPAFPGDEDADGALQSAADSAEEEPMEEAILEGGNNEIPTGEVSPTPASPQTQSEPGVSREPTAAAPPTPQLVEIRERSRSPPPGIGNQREGRFIAQPGTPFGGERAPSFPFPV